MADHQQISPAPGRSDEPQPGDGDRFPEGWPGLLALARFLRSPDGCAWDREQSIASLAGHLVEESYEVLGAAEEGDTAAVSHELGDALFLVALAQAAVEEAGGPGDGGMTASALSKIRERHAHLFDGSPAVDARSAALLWERKKKDEAGEPANAVDLGSIAAPSSVLPALLQAQRVQQKAASVGFDWARPEDVFAKIQEEAEELRAEMTRAAEESGGSTTGRQRARMDQQRAVREEAGDLLFAVVNLVRLLGLDAEQTLQRATLKFVSRFNAMAAMAHREGKHLPDLDLAGMERLWESVKTAREVRD